MIQLFSRKGLWLLALSLLLFSSCDKKLKPATVLIPEPVRHCNPVIQGEQMKVSFDIENMSDNPLFIQEIQTTCGCVVPRNDLPIIILPHKAGTVHLSFDTIKNTGYVDHFVYCYGNFEDSRYILLEFDTNVVPRADYIRDYEQLSNERNAGLFSGDRHRK